jgi:hypothetical protein
MDVSYFFIGLVLLIVGVWTLIRASFKPDKESAESNPLFGSFDFSLKASSLGAILLGVLMIVKAFES